MATHQQNDTYDYRNRNGCRCRPYPPWQTLAGILIHIRIDPAWIIHRRRISHREFDWELFGFALSIGIFIGHFECGVEFTGSGGSEGIANRAGGPGSHIAHILGLHRRVKTLSLHRGLNVGDVALALVHIFQRDRGLLTGHNLV